MKLQKTYTMSFLSNLQLWKSLKLLQDAAEAVEKA